MLDDLRLQKGQLLGAAADGQRAFDVGQCCEDRPPVNLDQLALLRGRDINLAVQAAAVENRLRQRSAECQAGGRRAEEIEQHIARKSGRSGELDCRQQRGACGGDVGMGCAKLRLGAGEIRVAAQQIGG